MSIEDEIMGILDEYMEEVEKTSSKDMRKVTNETVKDLKNTSPKGPNGYANGWTVKTEKGPLGSSTFTVHNSRFPGLTHLLENSHVISNQYGYYGRSAPQKHIAPAEQRAISKLIESLESDL